MEDFENSRFTDSSQLPESLPLFPLPNVVLFPNMLLPLYIFEPRYKKMIQDCLRGNRLLGIILLRKDWEKEEGDPTPYEVGGMGQIIKSTKLPNGNMNILVRGVSKIRILEYLEVDEPYRVARIEGIRDRFEPSEDLTNLIRQLVKMFKQVISFRYKQVDRILSSLDLLVDPQDIAYFVVSILALDVHEKQILLETFSGEEQIRKLIRFLMRDLAIWN
jgi:Lon protease-like protein